MTAACSPTGRPCVSFRAAELFCNRPSCPRLLRASAVGVCRRIVPGLAALGGASLCPHPFNSTLSFCEPYGLSQSGWRSFSAASVKQKNPAEGGNRAAGCCEPETEGRVTFNQANLGHAFIKGGWLSVRFATLEPGNCFDYPHVRPCRVPMSDRPAGPLEQHLRAAAPATSNQHG